MAVTDRFTGGDAKVLLVSGAGDTIISETATSNVDELAAEYMPDLQKRQPLGVRQKVNQLMGYEWQVTVSGAIVANGLGHLAQVQADAYDRGADVPTITLLYTLARTGLSSVSHTFSGGVVSRETDTLRTDVTAQVIILFSRRL